MREAITRLTWTPSVSLDVVGQELRVSVDGLEVYDEMLDAVASTFEMQIPEGAAVLVKLRASDGFFESEWATLEFVLPDLEMPLAPTGLGIEIVEVIDTGEDDSPELPEDVEEAVVPPPETPAEEETYPPMDGHNA